MLNTDHQRSEASGEYRPWAPPTRRVLWIDDEVSDDCVEVQYLHDQGITVCCAQSADSGLARLESESFEAVGLEHSHFDRDFVKVFGIPPTALRRRVPTLGRR